MKKIAIFAFLAFFLTFPLHAADAVRQFKGSGQVITVDPVYSQITIEHGAIKGFTHDGQTQFYVSEASLLKGISTNDLVDFELTDNKGDVKIDKLAKTGVALPKEEGVPLGEAVQQTLQGAGEVVRTVASPLPPVSEAVGGAVDSTSSAADPKIQDGELKQKITTF